MSQLTIFESNEYQLTYVLRKMVDKSIGFIACFMFICIMYVTKDVLSLLQKNSNNDSTTVLTTNKIEKQSLQSLNSMLN